MTLAEAVPAPSLHLYHQSPLPALSPPHPDGLRESTFHKRHGRFPEESTTSVSTAAPPGSPSRRFQGAAQQPGQKHGRRFFLRRRIVIPHGGDVIVRRFFLRSPRFELSSRCPGRQCHAGRDFVQKRRGKSVGRRERVHIIVPRS